MKRMTIVEMRALVEKLGGEDRARKILKGDVLVTFQINPNAMKVLERKAYYDNLFKAQAEYRRQWTAAVDSLISQGCII